MDIPHFVHPFICWWTLGLFPALAIMTSAAMNTDVQVSVFNSFGYIHRCGIAECYGNAMLSFLRNCQTVFHSGWTALHSHQWWGRVPISPHPHQHFLFSIFCIVTIPVGVTWYLTVVLICISLMTKDVEHLFVFLLAICIPSLQKCLFKPCAHF